MAVAILVTSAYAFRAPLLTGLANAWIINDQPAKADAIIILGGGIQDRPFAAARLYNSGFAPKILISNVALKPTEQLGLNESEADLTRKILEKQGVPDDAVEAIGSSVKNTFGESKAALDWSKQKAIKRLLICTDIFHSRRARWVFHKQFRHTDIDVRLVAVQPWDFQSTNWWQCEQGFIAFQNECAKFAYYWIKY